MRDTNPPYKRLPSIHRIKHLISFAGLIKSSICSIFKNMNEGGGGVVGRGLHLLQKLNHRQRKRRVGFLAIIK